MSKLTAVLCTVTGVNFLNFILDSPSQLNSAYYFKSYQIVCLLGALTFDKYSYRIL
ncbi:hypothetical protein GCM10008018_33820 [Paenibacillus marchantiophytorum]|uniref:Uncharacterized protein n=1 Tax=Paenibacillus marchantiophytorum TaxID=1619310 RepID=A0ABQ1ES80_9BACL|nr:hypothetical protein GCM10008018_33820 [Paenibacillus marchantiophytorum]